jgi:CheY-like chemotaxis protein
MRLHLVTGEVDMGGAKRIMIVDDEPSMTTYLATLLEDHGYEAHCANDPEEALERIRDLRPDVILLDLLMPKKSGVTLFQKISRDESLAHIPIIVVTGIHDHMIEDFRSFFSSLKLRRPFAFLEKPVVPEELLGKVRESLAAVN